MSMDDTEGTPTEHADPAGKGQHPGKGAGRGGFVGKHRDQILVGSSVLLVVLAWLSLRKTSGSATAASGAGYLSPTSAAQAGLGSAGAVGGYNAEAQQGLQTLLANQSGQLSNLEAAVANLTGAGSSLPTATPAALSSPLASTLYNPVGTGNYVRQTDGLIAEVESDGSLFGLTGNQFASVVQSNGGTVPSVTQLGKLPNVYSLQSNLDAAAARRSAATATP